jgi:arylsulfatase A-like enzyme
VHRCLLPVALVALITVGGCGHEIETVTPLFDSAHTADVLTEASDLANPLSVDQNRLLRGWRFTGNRDGRRIRPNGPEAVVEFVQLERRPRLLIVGASAHRPGDTVRATVGDRDLGIHPVSKRLEIPLPADLPLGRVALTLRFSTPEATSLDRLRVKPFRAPGEALMEGSTLTLQGWSAVEMVRRVGADSVLVARFQPPEGAKPGQRFTVDIERPGNGAMQSLIWESGDASNQREIVPVELPLGSESGLVRIRLAADGAGPAGRWIDAGIVCREPPPPDLAGPEIPPPPRLVLLYVMDALRADRIGRLDSGTELTPVLDGIADGGCIFANHFAVAPNTPPSTRALFIGLTMLDDRQLPQPGPTRIAEVFRSAGFQTVSITGNPHLSPDLDLGIGFDRVSLLRVREDHHPDHRPTVNDSAGILHAAAVSWLEGLPPDEPGFLYLHSMNPHNPYTPPPEIEAQFAPASPSSIDGRTRTLVAIRDRTREVSGDDIDRIRRLYSSGVAYNDRELDRLLTEISRRFAPDEVLVIFTSDHGEELFEHDGVLHGYTLYDEMLRVPLIMSWPGRIRPHRIESLTSTVDLHASLQVLLGGDPDESTGRSLWPEIFGGNSERAQPEITFAAAPGLAGAAMARSPRWKLIQSPRNGRDRGMGKGRGRSWDVEYVFDLVNDPDEEHNLAGTDELEVAWLRSRLTSWLETQKALQPAPGTQVMDDETKDQLEALGYVVNR